MTDSTPATNNQIPPPPPDIESKFQRSVGILIGFGIGLAIICLAAALFAYSNYSDFSTYLNFGEPQPQGYLPRDLLSNMLSNIAFYMAFGLGGIFCIVIGLLSLKSKIFREALLNKNKYILENYFFSFGLGLVILSLYHGFIYLLALSSGIIDQNFELRLLIAFFSVGFVLSIVGILSLKQKTRQFT